MIDPGDRGRGPSSMEDNKNHHANHQQQKSKHFWSLYLGIEVTKENTVQASTEIEQHFTYLEKRQQKISFNSGYQSPRGQEVSLHSQHRAARLHAPPPLMPHSAGVGQVP